MHCFRRNANVSLPISLTMSSNSFKISITFWNLLILINNSFFFNSFLSTCHKVIQNLQKIMFTEGQVVNKVRGKASGVLDL